MVHLALLIATVSSTAAQTPPWPEPSHQPRWQPTDTWRDADFAVLSSELSPGVLRSSPPRPSEQGGSGWLSNHTVRSARG